MKNAFTVTRADHVRASSSMRPPNAKLLSHAEYCSAEGDADIPLWGDDPAFGKVAASGRSSSLLNTDWMVRCGRGCTPASAKQAPATGYINPVLASNQALDDRAATYWEAKRREERRRLKDTGESVRKKQLIILMEQHYNRVYNVNLQRWASARWLTTQPRSV